MNIKPWVKQLGVTCALVSGVLLMVWATNPTNPAPRRIAQPGPSCDVPLGQLPRSYKGICLGWTENQVKAAFPSSDCRSNVCGHEMYALGVKTVFSQLRDGRVARINVHLTADAWKQNFNELLERAKQEYGTPVSEKVPLSLRTSESKLSPDMQAYQAYFLAAATGIHTTTWDDDRTKITLSYFPDIFGGSPGAGLYISDREAAQKEGEERRLQQDRSEQAEEQQRQQMFSR